MPARLSTAPAPSNQFYIIYFYLFIFFGHTAQHVGS